MIGCLVAIDRPRLLPARVTRSSTSRGCRRPRTALNYFFFAAFFFAVFFTAFFAAAFVVFRFFAIAALLALSGWRHRCSAVANRAALTIDYYSRKKITVTRLNFVCKRRAPRARRRRGLSALRATRRRPLCLMRPCTTFRTKQRSADKMGIFDMPRDAVLKVPRAARARRSGVFARAKTPPLRDFPTRKKIRGKRAERRFERLQAGQNARIGAERFACAPRRSTAARRFAVPFSRCKEHERRLDAARADDQQRDVQTPRRRLRRSLTACGLALPPDAFIT